jgi:hypothetical protein
MRVCLFVQISYEQNKFGNQEHKVMFSVFLCVQLGAEPLATRIID